MDSSLSNAYKLNLALCCALLMKLLESCFKPKLIRLALFVINVLLRICPLFFITEVLCLVGTAK